MTLNIENTYRLITISLSLLFSLYVLFNKTNERRGNIFIGFFILYLAIESLDVFLSQTSFYSNCPNFYLVIPALGFLIYPSWFFYIKTTAFKDFKLRKIDFLHLTPIVLMSIIFLFNYHLQPNEVKLDIRTNSSNTPWFVGLTYYMLRIQGISYAFLSISTVYRFKKIVRENYSSINKKNYKWVLQLTFVFIYFIVAALFYNILKFWFKDFYSEDSAFHHITSAITLVFLCWIIYKGLSQPYLFNGVDSNIKLLEEYIKEKKDGKKQPINHEENSQKNTLKKELEEYVKNNKVYTNPSLTIFELAKGLGLSSYELSFFLNKHLNRNFFDFINEYRIKEAMQILQDPNKKSLTILEVLYEVGFNSKSSFNTAFKKHTGLTPTEFKKSTHPE